MSQPPWEMQGLSWQPSSPRETDTSVHPCAQQGKGEISIWVTTLQDPNHERLSATCLLTADIFSCRSTNLSDSEVLLECLNVWKSKWKCVKQICLMFCLLQQHIWKKWKLLLWKVLEILLSRGKLSENVIENCMEFAPNIFCSFPTLIGIHHVVLKTPLWFNEPEKTFMWSQESSSSN